MNVEAMRHRAPIVESVTPPNVESVTLVLSP